jgi:hypothetical protein
MRIPMVAGKLVVMFGAPRDVPMARSLAREA